jgi:hypothetical protein
VIRQGAEHACAILVSGDVRCWGLFQGSKLGGGSLETSVPLGGMTATAVALGAQHTCVIVSSGGVKCWGENREGQIGVPFSGSLPPTDVPLPAGLTATSIGADRLATCVTMSNGTVYCWGGDSNGQLGGIPGASNSTPTRVLLPPGLFATSVSVAAYHVCATTSVGSVVCWGYGPPATLAPGSHLPTVIDLFGETVGPDVLGPTPVTFTASPNTVFAVGETSTLTATGTDNVGVVKVEFYDEGNTLIGTDSTPADGFTQVVSSFSHGSPPVLAAAAVSASVLPGTYLYTAKLFDAAGNSTTTSPASITIAVAPETAIDSGPDPLLASSSTTAGFSFSANPATGATFECALDGAAFATCTTPIVGLADGTHTYQVRASNIGGTDPTPATRTWNVKLPAAPKFTSDIPTLATLGSPYLHKFTADGVPSTITFSAPPGSLPVDLTLTSAGVLSGTPSAFGSTSFVVTASNGVGPDATAQVTIEVQAAPKFTAFTPPASATVGTAYAPPASAGTAGYLFAAEGYPSSTTFRVASGSLPDGLTLSEGGLLSGSPTQAAAAASPSTFTVSATNSVGSVTTGQITITVTGVVAASPDLSLRMEADGPARTGSLLTYQLSVRNLSSTAAAGPITIVTQLPAGVTYQSGGNRQWICTSAGQVVTCVRASGLRASDEIELKIVARINAPSGTILTTTATLSPTDFNPSNNTVSNSTQVRKR